MKASNINGRIDKAGKHNDRNFNVSLSDHIDPDRSDQNRYWTYNGDDTKSFHKLELEFYREHFKDYLHKRNKAYTKNSQQKLTKKMEDYCMGRYTRPEDKILQIGDIKDHISGDELWKIALDYQKWFDDKYGDNCKILDMALHMDEATPHVHVRRVWIGHDAEGNECVGQGKALAEMGILPPDTQKPIGRYNNAKMTFTYEDQAVFREIAREHGIEIEEPTGEKQKHLSVKQYKSKMIEQDLERTRERVQEAEKEAEKKKSVLAGIKEMEKNAADTYENLLLDPVFNGEFDERVRKAREKDEEERVLELSKMYSEEAMERIQEMTRQAESELMKENRKLKRKLAAAEKVIREADLEHKYNREKQKDRSKRKIVL